MAICFIDDIIVFSATFEDHIRDLDDILTLLENAALTVSPHKCFVGYHSLKILGQLVDRFGVTMTAQRADGILRQTYLKTLDKTKSVFSISNNRIKSPLFVFIPIQAKAYSDKQLAEVLTVFDYSSIRGESRLANTLSSLINTPKILKNLPSSVITTIYRNHR